MSESVFFFFRHEDLGHRLSKDPKMITQPPSRKEAHVLVMFLVCLRSWEK